MLALVDNPAPSDAAAGTLGLRQAIEARLDALLPAAGTSPALAHAIRHAVLGPGKRIRPTLVVLLGAEWGAPRAPLLDAGCALELVHNASLVIDDLPAMDDAPLRRGRPTTHAVHGVDVAMLAAIALLSRAFALVGNLDGVPPARCTRLVTVLAAAVGEAGLAGGQCRDLRGAAQGFGAEIHAHTCAQKTGVLFDAAIAMAATLSDVDDARAAALRRFAWHFGQAFQIADDLHDAVEDSNGPPTFVSLHGVAGSRRLLNRHVEAALACLESRQGPLAVWLQSLFGALRAA